MWKGPGNRSPVTSKYCAICGRESLVMPSIQQVTPFNHNLPLQNSISSLAGKSCSKRTVCFQTATLIPTMTIHLSLARPDSDKMTGRIINNQSAIPLPQAPALPIRSLLLCQEFPTFTSTRTYTLLLHLQLRPRTQARLFCNPHIRQVTSKTSLRHIQMFAYPACRSGLTVFLLLPSKLIP